MVAKMGRSIVEFRDLAVIKKWSLFVFFSFLTKGLLRHITLASLLGKCVCWQVFYYLPVADFDSYIAMNL